MGISGLLQFIKEYRSRVNISKYSGQTAAVDVSCWIHQGAYYADFSEGVENAVQKIIHFVTRRIRILLDRKIKPIIVFDGAPIPVKRRIQEERMKIRINSREKVNWLLKEGRADEANK